MKVYIMHLIHCANPELLQKHYDNIVNDDIDQILVWADMEYDVNYILGTTKFVELFTPYLEQNNKTILVVAPGFNRTITDRIKVCKGPAFYFVNRNVILQYSDRDFTDVHTLSDKLYTMYARRGCYERKLMVDLLAREQLLNDGIVTYHDIDSNSTYQYRYHDGSPLIDEENYSKSQYSPLDFPVGFLRGFVDIVCESRVDPLEFFTTEKTVKSLTALKPFITLSCQHYHRYIHEEYGIEPYTEIFDYSFDSEPRVEDRIEGIIENVKQLKNKDKNLLHSLVLSKMMQNRISFKGCISKKENMMGPELEFFNEQEYELLGDTQTSFCFWLDSGKKYGWLK